MTENDKYLKPGDTRCLRFANADGKAWILPCQNIRTGLGLYQPSSPKGVLLKRFLPYILRMPALTRRIGMTNCDINLSEELRHAVAEAFNVEDFEFAVFEGTPSVHCKITIQIFNGREILGYVKLTESPEIDKLFNHEQRILDWLHSKGMENIPKCLFNGQLKSAAYCFIQSTVKTIQSHSPHRWTPLHDLFLTELYRTTTTEIRFDDSDFARLLMKMQRHSAYLPGDFRQTVLNNIDKLLSDNTGKMIHFSAYHGDFTPWNMLMEQGKLFVFDWEYAAATYPPMLDRYHFHVQQGIHVEHLSARRILDNLQSFDWFTVEECRCYLLDMIVRYTLRENGRTSAALQSMLKIWVELLICLR